MKRINSIIQVEVYHKKLQINLKEVKKKGRSWRQKQKSLF